MIFAAVGVSAEGTDALVADENRVLFLEQERKRQKISKETVHSIK